MEQLRSSQPQKFKNAPKDNTLCFELNNSAERKVAQGKGLIPPALHRLIEKTNSHGVKIPGDFRLYFGTDIYDIFLGKESRIQLTEGQPIKGATLDYITKQIMNYLIPEDFNLTNHEYWTVVNKAK